VEVAVFIVIVALIVVVGQTWGKQAKAKRRAALTEVAESADFMLAGELDPEAPVVSGNVRGFPLTYRLVTRGSGSNKQSWTECEVEVATDQLDIALRAQTRGEERWVEKGLARDELIGDDEFDARFIVEAAPAALAKRALDEELRKLLLAHHPLEVKSQPPGLLFEKRGWIEEPHAIRTFADMAAMLAARMNDVVRAAREQDQREAALDGYRGATPEARRAGEIDAREQTDALKSMREERAEAIALRNRLILVAIAVALCFGYALQYC
jgi:hypothetical protein